MISFLIEENENVKKFFEGDDSCIPVSELMYLHTRPLLRPNFITQVDDLVGKVGGKIVANKVTGKPVEELIEIAIQMGTQMDGEFTEEKAKKVLFAMRRLYKMCNILDGKLK